MKSYAISFLGLNIINLFLKGILQMLSRNLSQFTAYKSVANMQYLATIENYSGVISREYSNGNSLPHNICTVCGSL